jgi:hypothetical protein
MIELRQNPAYRQASFFCDIQTNYGKNRKTTMMMNNSNVPHMVNIRVIPIFKANH